MDKIIVSCKNLVKTFGKNESKTLALRGATFDIYQGQLVMIVGPSGCGKTTLISCLSGLLNPESGDCTVLGLNISQADDKQLVLFRRKYIGFVFQSFNLITALNAVENVALPLTISGVKEKEAYKKAKELLDAVGLRNKYNSKPKQLSGGQQQRVAIARALVHNPKLVICDEPTSSLDHTAGELIMKLLKKMQKEKQTTVVVVTHDNRIYKYADSIIFMEDGVIMKIKDEK